jgi:hypothetical protein
MITVVHPLQGAQCGKMFGQAIAHEVDTFDLSSIAFATVDGGSPWRIGVKN